MHDTRAIVPRSLAAPALAVASVLLLAAPAPARGVIESTKPARNTHVPDPPKSVTITLTEAPTNEAQVVVHDGCARPVATALTVRGSSLVARTPAGEPGIWHVVFRAVSSVDGHLSRGSFGFHVGGKADCTPGGGDKGGAAPGDGDAAPPTEGTGPSFPVVPAVLAGAGIIALAVIARVVSSR